MFLQAFSKFQHMNFRTQVPIKPLKNKIDYSSKVIQIGSCFSNEIGNKLKLHQFQNTVNPFGILFHPKAIARSILKTLNQEIFTSNDVFCNKEIWSCFETHSDMNDLSEHQLINKLNQIQSDFEFDLKSATHLIITLGTAWVYRFHSTKEIVANCHKIPQKEFTKELLSIEEIYESLNQIQDHLNKINPEIQLIYTISPVRHIKDGFVENNQSKAHLIAALQKYFRENTKVYYFPSYEILLDELRDYRFYKSDMLHPSQIAVDYIWEKFVLNCIDDKCLPVMKKVLQIHKGLSHRSILTNSTANKKFLEDLTQKINELLEKYPFMNF